jgi:hypothetical protein
MPFIRATALAERLLQDREARKVTSEHSDTPCFHCGKMFVYRGPRGDPATDRDHWWGIDPIQ